MTTGGCGPTKFLQNPRGENNTLFHGFFRIFKLHDHDHKAVDPVRDERADWDKTTTYRTYDSEHVCGGEVRISVAA